MPSDRQRTVDSMIFDAVVTTTANDFTGEPNKQYGPVTIPKRTFAKMNRSAYLNYQQTLEPWKGKPAHFALYLKRKEIVNTNPREVQKVFTKQPDEQHKQSVRTRPRIVAFAPAVSMDDIPERAREIIVDSIYKSSQMSNEIPRLLVKPAAFVSPEWRMDSVSWDGRQHRTYCQATEYFWLNRDKERAGKTGAAL